MSNYIEQIEGAIRATAFHSSTSYSWFGKRSPDLRAPIRRVLTPQAARLYILYSLQQQLYRDFYCRGFATRARVDKPETPVMGMTPFVEQLSAANSGRGYWASGWEVHDTEEKAVVLRKSGIEVRARMVDCLLPADNAIEKGVVLSLRF